jgi:hypothetical protein
VQRILSDIAHYNPRRKFDIDTGGKWLPDEKGVYHLVLKCIFGCFP